MPDAQQNQAEEEKPHVSGAPLPPNQRLVHTEERIEYRDQDGNLLDEEQVKALEGKVEFKTRYETRTRLIDAQGNEVFLPGEVREQEEPAGVAPPHPDVQGMLVSSRALRGRLADAMPGVDRETPKRVVPDEQIPEAKKSVEGEKEREEKAAKPASEGNAATKKLAVEDVQKDEL